MGQSANSRRNATLDNKKQRAAARGENVSKGERNSILKDSMRQKKGAAPVAGAFGKTRNSGRATGSNLSKGAGGGGGGPTTPKD